MSLADNLLVDVDDTLGRLHAIAAISQVVDGFEEDDPFHSLLAQQVAAVAVNGSRAETSAQHAVAADAHVEHGHLVRGIVVEQPSREHVGPAVLLVGGGAAAVGDAVAQDGHRASLGGSHHL